MTVKIPVRWGGSAGDGAEQGGGGGLPTSFPVPWDTGTLPSWCAQHIRRLSQPHRAGWRLTVRSHRPSPRVGIGDGEEGSLFCPALWSGRAVGLDLRAFFPLHLH